MKTIKLTSLVSLTVFWAFLWLLPSTAQAQVKKRTCKPGVPGQTLEQFLHELNPGDTLLLSGTCNENVVIGLNRIIIDGQGTATISGVNPNSHFIVDVRGGGVTLKGLTITGAGENGIHVTGRATIDGNTIHNTGSDGIGIHTNGFAQIINNLIQDNPRHGVVVAGNANAHIGVRSVGNTVAQPNTIENNGGNGIVVIRSSAAFIVGNDIADNSGRGVTVTQVSHAHVANNNINGNGSHGVEVGQNSGVNLGRDTGTNISDLPNSTTANNGGFGIRCFINSYADGRLGSLNGNSGATSFPADCINSLLP